MRLVKVLAVLEPPPGVVGSSEGVVGSSEGVVGSSEGLVGLVDGVVGSSEGLVGSSVILFHRRGSTGSCGRAFENTMAHFQCLIGHLTTRKCG